MAVISRQLFLVRAVYLFGSESTMNLILSNTIIFLMQIFSSFRPLWGKNSVAWSHFGLSILTPVCGFLPPQRTGLKNNLEKWCINVIKFVNLFIN